jgi:hypothetical protein
LRSKDEEEYTKNEIVKHLKNIHPNKNIRACKGEDPPDYYIKVDSKKIAFEVTRVENTREEPERRTIEESFKRLRNNINERFGSKIPPKTILYIDITKPIPKFRKFKKSLIQFVEKIVTGKESIPTTYFRDIVQSTEREEASPDNKKFYDIEGEKVGFEKYIVDEELKEGQRRISIKYLGRSYDIEYLIESNFIDRIKEKEEKLKKCKGEKWLGILNRYPIVEPVDIVHSMRGNSYIKGSCFTKIFVVCDNKVIELK